MGSKPLTFIQTGQPRSISPFFARTWDMNDLDLSSSVSQYSKARGVLESAFSMKSGSLRRRGELDSRAAPQFCIAASTICSSARSLRDACMRLEPDFFTAASTTSSESFSRGDTYFRFRGSQFTACRAITLLSETLSLAAAKTAEFSEIDARIEA